MTEGGRGAGRQPVARGTLVALVAAMVATLVQARSACAQRPATAPRATAQVAAPLAPVEGAFHFLVMGDWGRHGIAPQRAVAKAMATVAERLDAGAVINTGDNFYPSGVASVDDPAWRASFEEVYTAHALQVEWWSVLGNHDYRGNPEAEVRYTERSRRWRMPARNWSTVQVLRDGTRAAFFFIDTSPLIRDYWKDLDKYHLEGTDSLAPVRWLDSALTATTAQWKVVVGHHHIYSGGKRPTQPELEEKVRPLLERHGVQVWFNGHEHDLQHIVPPGSPVEYFVSGAGSEHRPSGRTAGTRFQASALGFMAAALTAQQLTVWVVDASGRVLHTAVVPARR